MAAIVKEIRRIGRIFSSFAVDGESSGAHTQGNVLDQEAELTTWRELRSPFKPSESMRDCDRISMGDKSPNALIDRYRR
jgi:hypothetical protein